MTIEEYQQRSRRTALYPNRGNNFVYAALGLAGESGEVSDKIKKVIRDKGGVMDEVSRQEIAKELGDVLWYTATLADELNLSLEQIALQNLEKLSSRLERGVIKGSGDNR